LVASLVLWLVASTVHAGKAKDCLAACATQLAACTDTCGNDYGVGKKACRKGIVKRCRKLGIDVACAAGGTTTTTIPCAGQRTVAADIDWDPNVTDPLVHVTVTARPCVNEALIEVRQASAGDSSQVCLSQLSVGQSLDGPTAAGIRCALNEHVPAADQDDTFCAEMSAPADCFATSKDTPAVLRVRDLPPWLNIAHPFFLFVTTDHVSVRVTVD
jgi:hypothetical protein